MTDTKPRRPEYPDRIISAEDRIKIEKKLSRIDFGQYVTIEHHCYQNQNEHMTYKVIGTFMSNTWVDVPVWGYELDEVRHDEMVKVVSCIQCGLDEIKVKRYRLCDVEISDGPWDKYKEHATPETAAERDRLKEVKADLERMLEYLMVLVGPITPTQIRRVDDAKLYFERKAKAESDK